MRWWEVIVIGIAGLIGGEAAVVGRVSRMLRICIGAVVGMMSLGVVETSFGEDGLEGLSGLIAMDSPSCSDDVVMRRTEGEFGRLRAILELCDATSLGRLFNSDLAGLNSGCDAVEVSTLTNLVSILADPEKSEITCADKLSLLLTVNKAFRDGVAQEEASERRRPVEIWDGPSFDDMLASIAGADDEPPPDAAAPAPLTGPLRRTITNAIKQKVERNWLAAKAPAPRTGLLRRTITDAIKQKVERNWSVPAGLLDAGELVVTLRIQLAPDGSVRRVEIVDADGGANYRTIAESGRRAVLA